MDDRTRPGLHPRLLAALGALLPDGLRDHPDAQALFDRDALPAVDEAALAPLTKALALSPGEQLAVALALWVEFDAALALSLIHI